MHRKLSAAMALALLGAPLGAAAAPASAQTIHIQTAGKSPAQLSAEIRAAAQQVCWSAYTAMPTPLTAYSACVQDQTKSAQAQLRDGKPLAQLSTDRLYR